MAESPRENVRFCRLGLRSCHLFITRQKLLKSSHLPDCVRATNGGFEANEPIVLHRLCRSFGPQDKEQPDRN